MELKSLIKIRFDKKGNFLATAILKTKAPCYLLALPHLWIHELVHHFGICEDTDLTLILHEAALLEHPFYFRYFKLGKIVH